MRVVTVFLLCSLTMFAQEDSNLNGVFVQCYYDKDVKTPLLVYDTINGEIVDSLYNIDDKKSWYKLTVLESEYGWFKIKEIMRFPSTEQQYNFENYWVKNLNFLINVDDYDQTQYVYLYDLPSTKANKIHKLDGFQKVSVTEVDGHWSKVKFRVGKKEIEGWLGLKYQIANPLTTSSKYD